MRITVFTPTYNRAYCLPRLYESLKVQTFHDFEWVIIDDGSVDNTEEVVNRFVSDKPFFTIKYKKTENGGKHRAINRGMDLVDGELFLMMDSDDWLREDALEWIDKVEASIPQEQKKDFGGVYGLRVHTDGSIIGSTFAGDTLDATYFERGKCGISGDKAEVYYSYLMRKYHFPEFEGEKFCTECLVWDQIAAEGLKLRFFNEGIYFCEYLEDGLTYAGNMLYARNPKQYGMYVHNNWVFRKQDRLHAMIKIYEYYLYEKDCFNFDTMKNYLALPGSTIRFSIVIQYLFDLMRIVLHNGKTVRKYVLSDKNVFSKL